MRTLIYGNRWLVAGATLGIVLVTSPLLADDTSDELKALRQQIEALSQKVLQLEQKSATDKETMSQVKTLTEKAKTAPLVSIGATGLKVSSADSNFVFGVRGYIQADGRFGVASSAANYADTFLMRRVRPVFEGSLYKIIDYRVMLDFGSGNSASSATPASANGTPSTSTTGNDGFVQDAWANIRFLPELQLQVGKMKPPSGLERSQSTANLLFIETGFPTMLTPNYSVGAMLQGDVIGGKLNYQAGIFNSAIDGGSTDFQTFDQGYFAGRVMAAPLKGSDITALEGLSLGLGGTYGSLSGTAMPTYRTTGQQGMFSYVSGVATDGEQWRFAPQGSYYWGPFGLYGEYVVSSQAIRKTTAPVGSGSFINRGWQVAASYFITGEKNSWKPVTVKSPLNFTKDSGWGAVELAARVQGINYDSALFPTFANPNTAPSGAFAWGVGANWYWSRNLKISLNYDNTDFHGGNGNQFTAQNEQVIITQLQLSF